MNEQAAEVAGPPASSLEKAHVPLLLVADPDEGLGHELAPALAERGVEVIVCTDGAQALVRAGKLHPDVLLISATLPMVDAVTFVRAIRATMSVPVILGVGADNADEAIKALEAGANVCVARPYRLPELLPLILGIRVDGAAGAEETSTLTCGPIELDPRAHVVRVRGKVVHMPLREFELLHYLMIHADRVVSRQQIQTHVWKTGKVMTNTISVHIRRLRDRLDDDADEPRIILTVRGLGYRIVSSLSEHPTAVDSAAPAVEERPHAQRPLADGIAPPRFRPEQETVEDEEKPDLPEPDASSDPSRPLVELTSMSRAEAERVADTFKPLADPTRLQLLSMIEKAPNGEACVLDLTAVLGVKQATVSHHLKVLVDAGFLNRDKRGQWSWFAIVPGRLDALQSLIGDNALNWMRARHPQTEPLSNPGA